MHTLNISIRAWLVVGFLSLCFVQAPAWAADLDTAKARGLIGERADGYLGLVDESADGQTRELVKSTNARRAAQYAKIAAQNNISVGEVEALAGQKTFEKTASGHWYFSNEWKRKP